MHDEAPKSPGRGRGRALAAVVFIMTAVLINAAVVKNELLLGGGRTVIMALDSVSTSSMSSGGYMELLFKDSQVMVKELNLQNQITGRRHTRSGKVILGGGDNGVYAYANLYTGQALGDGEVLLDFKLRGNIAVIGGNAFYFKNRFSSSYAKARYASLRVDSDGTAIVVGLLDADMKPLLPEQRDQN